MTEPVVPHLDNVCALPAGRFAAIIGANPSRGARSPTLWNAVYEALGWDCRMWPFDVTAANLPALLEWLARNPDFVGGAVAVPHKQAIAQWLGDLRLDASAQGILAVNALMRDTTGQLRGANTDGLAAAQVLLEVGLGAEDFVLVFGFGGAAKAVINAIRHQVARVQVVTRSHASLETQTLARWMSIELIAPEAVESVLAEATVIINGTSLGSQPDYVAATPLPPNFAEVARRIRIAFDVVYQPAETSFMASMPSGVIRLGGGRMNFLQAVQAFRQVHPEVPANFITQTMQQALT